MPLDAAEFISELSIVDPPGTDPLNQGDDQIRTTKRAVQQSFPNVGSAVPQTGVQMAQMAIKNEVNTFTQQNTFEQNLQVNAQGRFTGNILMQQAASNAEDVDIRFQQFTPGATRWRIRSTATDFDFQIRRQDVNGQFIDSPIEISSEFGFVNFGGLSAPRTTASSAAAVAAWVLRDEVPANRWQLRRESSNDGGDFIIQRRDAAGALQDNPVRILASTAQIIFNTANITHQIAPGGTQLSHNWANTSAISRWGIIYSQTTGALTIHPRSATGSLESAILRLDGNGRLFMDRLPTGPTANTKEIYAKQSQLFAGTELVLGQTP